MSEKLSLQKVTAYTVYSSDNEISGSEKGIYKSSGVAAVAAQSSGWYGVDGEVLVKENVWQDDAGLLYIVKEVGRYVEEKEKILDDMVSSIRAKLTRAELDFLGIK